MGRRSTTKMTRPAARWWVMLALVPVVLAPALAHAGKKVVVMQFQGAGHAEVRASVVKELAQGHTVVPHTKVVAESKKLGIGVECNETNIMGVASIFGAEGVICGAIKGGKLKVTVYNGGDGKKVKAFRIKIGAAGLSARGLGAVIKRANAALAKTWNWNTVDQGGDKPAEPTPKAASDPAPLPAADEPGEQPSMVPDAITIPGQEPGTATTPAPRKEKVHPDDVVAAVEDTEDPLSRKPRKRSRRTRARVKKKAKRRGRVEGWHALRLGVGPGILFRRNFRFYNASADKAKVSPAALDKMTEGWKPPTVGGLALDAEFYPGAWLGKGWAGRFGLGVSYERYFGISWRADNDPTSHAATHQSVSVDLRARYQILDRPWLPLVYVIFGFNYLQFAMNDDETKENMFPDVEYASLDLGVGGEVGLVPQWLHLAGWFHYYPVLSRGEIAEPTEWGAAYGGGWRAGGALRGKLWGPLGWRFEFDYSSYLVSFKQLEDEKDMRKGNADKARDSYINGVLFVTFVN